MPTLLPSRTSRVRRAAGALLRSPVGSLLDELVGPHGLDRYLELVDPLLARDEDRAVVTAVEHETADVTTLTLRPNRWRGHRAGQHVQVTVEVDGRRRTRCYSVSSSEHRADGQLTITVKSDPDGTVSPFLAEARPGLVVGISAAQGSFTVPRPRPDRLLLLSGGSGITPVMSILRTLAHERAETRVTFLHYARTAADVAFGRELRQLAVHHPTFEVVTVLTRQPHDSDRALTGHLTMAHLEALGWDLDAADAYVCGPVALVDDAIALWEEAGALDRLHVERFQASATPAPATADAVGRIAFAASGRDVGNDGRSLLDQAEAAGLTPQAGCRMGICHTCITPKLAGQVRDTRDGRVSSCDPEDVQLCVSVPVGDVTLDL